MDIGCKENAIKVIEKVLRSIHNEEYKSIVSYVDKTEIEDMDSLFHFVQGTLELNGYDSIDEYGVPCNFHPEYKYSQMSFYEYDDNSGFAVDYDLPVYHLKKITVRFIIEILLVIVAVAVAVKCGYKKMGLFNQVSDEIIRRYWRNEVGRFIKWSRLGCMGCICYSCISLCSFNFRTWKWANLRL